MLAAAEDEAGFFGAGAILRDEILNRKVHRRQVGQHGVDRADLEIAAESTTQSPVKYQDVIRAMDYAIKVGFIDVGLSDPAGLAARPSL